MISRPKTIQIFLPGGDPRGIRVAEITTRIVQVIEVPRSLFQDFLRMPESNQVALYFLVGEAEDGGDQRVYVGQTGDLRARLVSHNREKEFWERALILISRTNTLTQTHALFLEWHCLQSIRAAARYADVNGNNGSKPHTPAPLEADCLEIFETGHALLATLGYPLLDAVARGNATTESTEIFYCKRGGVEGRGLYTSEGFVVLNGSTGAGQLQPSAHGSAGESMRDDLLQAGVMVRDGDRVVFQRTTYFGHQVVRPSRY